MKKITSFICLFTIFTQVYLFTEDDLSIEVWSIDDYKQDIITRFSRDNRIIIENGIKEFIRFETGEIFFFIMYNIQDKYTYIDLVSFNNDEMELHLISFWNKDEDNTKYFLQDIPGNQLWESLATIGDFNNDGIDEIATIDLHGGSASIFLILGINPANKNVDTYFHGTVAVSMTSTYTPVEFVNYKGMYGFKIMQFIDPKLSKISYPILGGPRNTAWIFYTWDETQRKYIEIEEVDPRYIEEEGARLYQRELEELNKNEIEQFSDSEISLERVSAKTTKDSQFPLWLFIGGGLVLAVGVGVVVVVKKRK